MVATSVYAILGVGLFGERPAATKYFGHFSEAFFTMFQCAAGDGWGSGIARPMFESADASCTYRDEETGTCVFDLGVAVFFASYILIVVTVILNVVFAVLIDEFLKAQDQLAREKQEEKTRPSDYYNDRSVRGFLGPLDPFLKYVVSEFQSYDEMVVRIKKAFDFFDYNNNGEVDFLEVKVGLQRLNLYPRVELLEEDWRDMTNDGKLCGDSGTLTYQQFFEVMRNQVTLYVQRVASKALNQEQLNSGKEDELGTTFVLKYLVTAVDDLRSNVISLQDPLPRHVNIPSVTGCCRKGGRKGRFTGFAKHTNTYNKRRQGLRGESARYQGPIMAEAVGKQPEVNSTCKPNEALTDFKACMTTCLHAFEEMLWLCPVSQHTANKMLSKGAVIDRAQHMAREVFVGADEGRTDVKDYTAKVALLVQSTCLLVQKYLFTGTKVQILTQHPLDSSSLPTKLLTLR